MKRVALTGALTAAIFVVPSLAYAETVAGAIGAVPLRFGASLLGLVIAVVLLVEALSVRKVAMGGAIAEKMSYVVLAIICLAASALAQWAQNFVADVTLEQMQLASQLLVAVAMALLTLYFASVRRALQDYMKAMTGSQILSAESTEQGDAERG
jgi:hypothetical protein